MDTAKAGNGIKWLIAFYCFVIVQHLSTRGRFAMNAGLEAVFLGTLIYLVVGFLRRSRASRAMAISFHVVFQAMETFAVFSLFNKETFAAMMREIPGGMTGTVRVTLAVVFALITLINISAIVYLGRHGDYFSGNRTENEGDGYSESPRE